MHASQKILAALGIIAATAFASFAAQAQEKMDGSDYHPLMMNSPSSADVQAGAIAAAHPAGTESVGQSTGATMPTNSMSSEEAYKGAYAASHATGTESAGQSTSLPMVRSGS